MKNSTHDGRAGGSRPATHEARIRARCSQLGIAIRQRGAVFDLVGAGVHISTIDLKQVSLADLLPPKYRTVPNA